jgi:hypothetical protein
VKARARASYRCRHQTRSRSVVRAGVSPGPAVRPRGSSPWSSWRACARCGLSWAGQPERGKDEGVTGGDVGRRRLGQHQGVLRRQSGGAAKAARAAGVQVGEQVAREQAIGSRETVGAIGEASAPVGWATLGRSGHEIRPCPVQNLFGVSAGCVAELYQAAIKASFFR